VSIVYTARKEIRFRELLSGGQGPERVVERGAKVVASADGRRAPRGSEIIPTGVFRHLVGVGAIEPAGVPLVRETGYSVAGHEVETYDSHPITNVDHHDQAMREEEATDREPD
jgi:hypothetical protein